MDTLSHAEVTVFFLSLGILLAAARTLGELARSLHQPAILGEMLAGILLGPTVLGVFAPEASRSLFPAVGPVAAGFSGLTTLAIGLFLLVAGTEVNLSTVWRQGRPALFVSISGMVFPFSLGFASAWWWPGLLGFRSGEDPVIFSLFFATALSISALPVVAKILLDLNLFRTNVGVVITASAILNDLVGWIIFALILGMISGTDALGLTLQETVAFTIGFILLLLTLGQRGINRILPWVQAHLSWPGGVLGFAISGALLCAAFTQWIGTHAVFGAFLFGVVLGQSPHLKARTRATFDQFISFIFAPLFFASIGLHVDFVRNFNPTIVLTVLVLASAGKVLGCGLGARWSGMSPRESWAVGFGMNARGAMEILLGHLALKAEIIDEPLFVALVIMALVTSLTSGTLMQRILRRKQPVRLVRFLTAKNSLGELTSESRFQAIQSLCSVVSQGAGLDAEAVTGAVWRREQLGPTGIGNGVAVPHARLDGLKHPMVGLGICRDGVDFDAPDGRPARLIVLILTPSEDPESQIELQGDVGRLFQDPELVSQVLKARGFTEMLSLIKSSLFASHAPS